MASSLIFFTPRTGSSILADLLAFKYDAWNLDEILSHQVRPQIISKLPQDVKQKIKQGNFNARERLTKNVSPDMFYQMMHGEILRAINFVETLSKENDVVVKCFTHPGALPKRVIEFAIKNKFEIYFLYRKDKEQQLHSEAAAMIKESFIMQSRGVRWSGHINTNTDNVADYPPSLYSEKEMHNICFQIGAAINTWHSLHSVYKEYGTTMCYEDTILKNDFTLANINQQLVDAYYQQKQHLVPTKNKVDNFITNWNQLKPIFESYIIHK